MSEIFSKKEKDPWDFDEVVFSFRTDLAVFVDSEVVSATGAGFRVTGGVVSTGAVSRAWGEWALASVLLWLERGLGVGVMDSPRLKSSSSRSQSSSGRSEEGEASSVMIVWERANHPAGDLQSVNRSDKNWLHPWGPD